MPRKKQAKNKLPLQLEKFVAEYLIDFNGVRAWRASHPKCSRETARRSASRCLMTNDVVRRRVEDARKAFYGREQMVAEEALALLSRQARAGIADFVRPNGTLLTPHEWPEELLPCVKKWKPETGEIELHDQQNALRLMAMAGGKLGDKPAAAVWTLEMFLRDAPPAGDDSQNP